MHNIFQYYSFFKIYENFNMLLKKQSLQSILLRNTLGPRLIGNGGGRLIFGVFGSYKEEKNR